MVSISLDNAAAVLAGALSKGAELDLKPLTVAVLDAGGHLIALQRQDGSSTLRPPIAIAKASSALSLGLSSRKIGEMALERPAFVSALNSIASNGIIPAAGGVIVTDTEGRLIGAVGVTGDTSDNDEMCALSGIAAAGLHAQV